MGKTLAWAESTGANTNEEVVRS